MLIDVAQSEFPADAPKLHRSDAALLAAEFFLDLRLDGQAVAIPARNVRRSKAGHGFRLYDHVFENFVQGRAEMDRAGRVRWTVVQNVGRRLFSCLLNPFVKLVLLPLGEDARLVLRKIRLHGEIRPREIQRAFQVNGFRHLSENSILLRHFGAIAARAAGSLRSGISKYSTYQTAMHKVKSHMVQFIFAQVSLVTRTSFWLPMNLTPMVEPRQSHVCND